MIIWEIILLFSSEVNLIPTFFLAEGMLHGKNILGHNIGLRN